MEEVSKQILLKKYKVSSEISTSSFDENNNEIYDENHDHSIIDSVNDDCLAEIFMYVPVFERPKIALVCQKWNRVLDYSWGNVKKLELTHWEYNEDANCLKKYPTPDGKLSFLKSLLNKCGRYLRQLDLTAYGHSDIVRVINKYCPNLVKLRLRFTSDNDEIVVYDAFSRLSKLKVLAVIFQYHEKHQSKLHYLITALLPLANTLTDLTLFNWKADDVSCSTNSTPNIPCLFPGITIWMLRRLKALKRFEFTGIEMFPQLEEYLRDSHTLECFYYDCFLP
ncbi:uncharacterized protein LOC122855733 isoform X2 [Aphidius gifuensis]|uniref:uncharacterized protein LOC122855733 isoform X2 n=2 Tax=Aphidius gifuensis TaxID=684658 RepID=UPI001CDD13BF|nr:uncharacterized protein LOC122855733 isoform X2 [Aphidius gifuensis]